MNEDDGEAEDPIMDLHRGESPTLEEQPPLPAAFCQLSIREQFAYVKPVMRAIMGNTYEPVRERHKAFMTQRSRQALRSQSHGIGDLSVPEFNQLGKVVQRWLVPKSTVVQAPTATSVPTMSEDSVDSTNGDQPANAVKSIKCVSHWIGMNVCLQETTSEGIALQNNSSRASSVFSNFSDLTEVSLSAFNSNRD